MLFHATEPGGLDVPGGRLLSVAVRSSQMTGSTSENGEEPTLANQAAEKGAGPTSSLIVAAVVHAGVFAWELGDPGDLQPVLRLPYGHMIASASGVALLSIFLIAAFARRSSLSFVVVPAMLVAGVAAHAGSSVLEATDASPNVLVSVLGFGALSVSINLSFGAAAIASRIAPSWSEAPFIRPGAFRLGAVLLVLVLGLATTSQQWAPLSVLTASVGLVVLGALLNAVERERGRGVAMAELVSGLALSIGATWVASVVGATNVLARAPQDWSQAQGAMRLGWLAAMPLILSAIAGLLPRVTATGAGVKRGLSTVLATTIGAVTCAGLSQVVLVRAAPLALNSRAPSSKPVPAALDTSATSPPKPTTSPASSTPSPTLAQPSASESPSAAPIASEKASAVEPASNDETAALIEESGSSKLTVNIKIDGPMLPKDAREGSAKSVKRLIECYEKSDFRGEPLELKLGLLIDKVGSVKQVDPVDKRRAKDKYMTCMQMAFYRSGFASPARLTWLEVALSFAPKAGD